MSEQGHAIEVVEERLERWITWLAERYNVPETNVEVAFKWRSGEGWWSVSLWLERNSPLPTATAEDLYPGIAFDRCAATLDQLLGRTG